MDFIPVKTRKFIPPADKGRLPAFLDRYLPPLKERDIIVITSKIVAISQGRFVPARSMAQKIKLIKQEADGLIPGHVPGLTRKDSVLTPYAGIDRTNAAGHYVFWPEKPHRAARAIHRYLTRRRRRQLGVMIIDSFCLPLRWGHMGITIGFWGFHPNRSYAGKKDIFGQKIIQGNSNYADALAATAGAVMGEGNEQTPLLIIRGFTKLKFTDTNTVKELIADEQKDMYAPLLKIFQPPNR